MKTLLSFCLLLMTFSTSASARSENTTRPIAVSYKNTQGKGRFGDQLLLFSHAAWFSHLLKCPLVYDPFKYSDQLCMHDDPDLLKRKPHHSHLMTLCTPNDLLRFYNALSNPTLLENTLIEIPFYPESPYLFEGHNPKKPQFTEVNWKDPKFLAKLRRWISPKKPLPKLKIPSNKVTVALHYRTGEGYDKKGWEVRFPLKAPPDDFYIDCLKYLSKIETKPLYVHIFTDSQNPSAVQAKFQALFPKIQFDSHTPKPGEDTVLQDFFGMEGFECLIRPDSHFSMMASYLFPYRMIFSPVKFYWVNKQKIAVDQILLEYNAPGMQPFFTTLRKDVH